MSGSLTFSDLASGAGDLAKGAIDFLTHSPLKLGKISFTGLELPEHIAFGGKQQISEKVLIGGRRIIEALGPSEIDPAWSGRFQGPNAMQRARAVDAIRKEGLPVTLNYGGMNFTVVVTDFNASYERFYQIPYSITCKIVSLAADDTNALKRLLNSSVSDLVGADTLNALGVGSLIGDVSLNSALSSVTSTLSTVGQITGINAISKVGGVIGNAQGVAGLLANAGNTSLQNLAFGTLGAAQSVGLNIAKLSGAVQASSQLANSTVVNNLLTRAGKNLAG